MSSVRRNTSINRDRSFSEPRSSPKQGPTSGKSTRSASISPDKTIRQKPPPGPRTIAEANASRLNNNFRGYKDKNGNTNAGYRAAKVAYFTGFGGKRRRKAWKKMPMTQRTNVARQFNRKLKDKADELQLQNNGKLLSNKQMLDIATSLFKETFEEQRKTGGQGPQDQDVELVELKHPKRPSYMPPPAPNRRTTSSQDDNRSTTHNDPSRHRPQQNSLPPQNPIRLSMPRADNDDEDRDHKGKQITRPNNGNGRSRSVSSLAGVQQQSISVNKQARQTFNEIKAQSKQQKVARWSQKFGSNSNNFEKFAKYTRQLLIKQKNMTPQDERVAKKLARRSISNTTKQKYDELLKTKIREKLETDPTWPENPGAVKHLARQTFVLAEKITTTNSLSNAPEADKKMD